MELCITPMDVPSFQRSNAWQVYIQTSNSYSKSWLLTSMLLQGIFPKSYVIVAFGPSRLSNARAKVAFESCDSKGLSQTCVALFSDSWTTTPCLPSLSWFTAITYLLVKIAYNRIVRHNLIKMKKLTFVSGDMLRISFPAINGLAIMAHIEKWALSSLTAIPFPTFQEFGLEIFELKHTQLTSSISASFQEPGRQFINHCC